MIFSAVRMANVMARLADFSRYGYVAPSLSWLTRCALPDLRGGVAAFFLFLGAGPKGVPPGRVGYRRCRAFAHLAGYFLV